MGRCHEFGLQISEGCNHEMVAGANECACAGCGVVCGGQFAGCPDVWARGQLVVQTSLVGAPERASGSAGDPLPDGLEQLRVASAPSSPTNGTSRESWPPEDPMPVAGESLRTLRAEAEPPRQAVAFPYDVPTTHAEATEERGAMPDAGEAGPSAHELSDVRRELRAVTEGLKLQQAMLADLLSGLTRQQAMMAELLDARHAELRLAMIAESLPDSVAEAVNKAFSANQEELTEAAAKIAKSLGMDRAVSKALQQVADWSDNRFEDLCVRQEKLVAKAMRAGARQTEPAPSAARNKPAATKKVAAAKKTAATRKPAAAKPPASRSGARAQAVKKTSRASSQGTRPSRRSLGS